MNESDGKKANGEASSGRAVEVSGEETLPGVLRSFVNGVCSPGANGEPLMRRFQATSCESSSQLRDAFRNSARDLLARTRQGSGLRAILVISVQCGLADLEKEVDENINHFIAWVEKHPNRRSQVCLSFFDEKNKHPGWFSNKTERIYWEQWFINLHVRSPKGHGKSHSSKALINIGGQALEEANTRRAALGLLIQEVLFQIINFANEKRDHIPPISDRIFNHEISIPSSSDSVFGWNADVLRKVLNS